MKQTLMIGTQMVGAQLPKFRQALSRKFWMVMTFGMAIATFATTTQAQWGSNGGGGSNGSYGSAAFGTNGGYGYSGGSTGSTGHARRIVARIHDHHTSRHGVGRRGGYGSTGDCGPIGGYGSAYGYGSTGGYGSNQGYGSAHGYGSTGGYGSNQGYGSTGGFSSYGGYGAPVGYGSNGGFSGSYRGASNGSLNTTSSSVVTRSQLTSIATQSSVAGTPIHLTVAVPTEARLFVNDRPTTTLGATRHFTSRALEQGNQYGFRVRAEMMDKNGKWISETQQISMRAGDSETLKFTFPEQSQLLVATRKN